MDSQQFLDLYQKSRNIAANLPQELKQPLYALGNTALKVIENPNDANTLSQLMKLSMDVVTKLSQSTAGQAKSSTDRRFPQQSSGSASRFPQQSAGSASGLGSSANRFITHL